MFKFILSILGLCLYANAFTQTSCQATLKGKVIDASTGVVVEDAVVYLEGKPAGDHTKANGEFILKHLCVGEITLICRHLNHEEKKETLFIKEGMNTKNIYLTCHTDTLHDVTIKSRRIHWEEVTVAHKLESEALRSSSGLSLGKTLERVNGVVTLNTGSHIAKPVIRGMHSNRVLIMNNGIRQEGQQWGNEHAPEIDPSLAKSIEVVKGAQTIQYGSDIIGGLILINPASIYEVKNTLVEINTGYMSNGRQYHLNALAEGRIKKQSGFTWRLHGSHKRGGNIKTPNYFLKNTGMEEWNYSGAIGYQNKRLRAEIFHSAFFSDIGIFSGSHIGNLTDLYTAFSSPKPFDSSGFSYDINFPKQQIAHYLGKVMLNYKLSSLFSLHALYGYQANFRKEFDKNLLIKNADGSYRPVLSFELNTHSLDFAVEHQEINHINGRIGVNGFYQLNNYYGNYFIPNYKKLQGGLYWVEKWHGNGLSLEAGLRYDVNYMKIFKWEQNTIVSPQYNFTGTAFNVAARYQLPLITIHLNGGSAWRAPFVNELYSYGVHQSAATFEIGDKTLKQERSYNVSVTMDLNYRQRVDMEWTLFYHYIKDYINLQPQLPATLTIRGAFPTMLYSQTNAVFYGSEWAANLHLHPTWNATFKANVLQVRDVTLNKFLVGMPPARLEGSVQYQLPVWLNTQSKLELGGLYSFKQNQTPTNADYVDAPPGYALLRAEWHAEAKVHHQPFHIYVGVNNLLNTAYREYLNRLRYFADEQGRNIYLKLSYPIILKQIKQQSYDVQII